MSPPLLPHSGIEQDNVMYNFLGLVNDVNRSLNEVELDQNNFAGAIGWYNQAKNSVNFAIQEINQVNFEWPWNHETVVLPLTVGTTRYAFPSDAKSVSFSSFRLKGDYFHNLRTSYLFEIDYEDYLQNYSDMENRPDEYEGTPKVVFRTPERAFGVAPAPDKSYDLIYEYYRSPAFLVNPLDVPSIPEAFRYTITEGAMHFAYRFRGDLELSAMAGNRFRQSIKEMRSIHTNRTEYLRSTLIPRR